MFHQWEQTHESNFLNFKLVYLRGNLGNIKYKNINVLILQKTNNSV